MEETLKTLGEVSANMCVLKAIVTTTDELLIKGSFCGTVASTSKVVIASGAKFEGTIIADDVAIEGSCCAEIIVKNHISIASGSRVNGSINYGSLQVDDGANICASTTIINPKQFEKTATSNKVYKKFAAALKKAQVRK